MGDNKEVFILELTVPFNSLESMKKAHDLKTNKYELLLSDLEAQGYAPKFLVMEIGALEPGTMSCLHKLFPSIKKDAFKSLLDANCHLHLPAYVYG